MSWKRLLIGFGVALAAVLLAQQVLREYLSLDRARALLERRLSDAAGLEARIDGGLALHLIPAPGLQARDVRLANLPGRPSPSLLSIESLDLVFDSWTALFGRLEIEQLKLAGVELHVESDTAGRFQIEHEVESLVDETVAGPVDFRLRSLVVEGARIFFFDGVRQVGRTLSITHLALESEDFDDPIAVAAIGDIDGAHFELRGEIGSLAALLAPVPEDPFPIAFAGQLLEASIEAKGRVAAPLDLAGFDIRFEATLLDLMHPVRSAGRPLPRVGPVVVSGQLSDAEGSLALRDFRAHISGDSELRGEVRGAISDLTSFSGVELTADLDADNLAFLAPIAGDRLPSDLSLTARVALTDQDGSLGLSGDASVAAPDGSLSIEATGEVDDLSHLDEIDVRVRLRARDLATLADALEIDTPLPAIGPIDATGRLRDHEERLAIDELTVRVGPAEEPWASVEGSVDDLAGFRGISLHVSLDASDARQTLAHLKRPLPELGPLRGRAHLHDHDGSLGIHEIELRAGDGDTLDLQVRGSLGDLQQIDEVTFDAKFAARDTTVVGALLGIELPAVGPVAFEGVVSGSDASVRSEGTLRLGKTAVSGSLAGSFRPGERVHWSASLESPHVHLEEISLSVSETPADPSSRTGATPAAGTAGGAAHIPFDKLRAFDADMTLLARRVTGRGQLDLVDMRGSLRLADGMLSMSNGAAGSEAGTAELELNVDASRPVPTITLRSGVRDIDLARIMAQFAAASAHTGRVDASLHLTSSGRTESELRSHLSGRVAGRLRDGNVASHYGQKFVKQFARVSIPDLRLRTRNPVDCLAMAFEIEDGVASVESLRIDAKQASITGSGSVDLAAGTYDLRLTPHMHDPSLMSVAAAVKVTGPLADPKFTPVPRTIATSAVGAVLRNALKPAGLVLRPLRMLKADGDEGFCQVRFDPAEASPEILRLRPDR